jgi:predicted dehydrogenase
MQNRICSLIATLLLLPASQIASAKEGVIRAGIIGCDTSHVIAFTKLINNPDAKGVYHDVEVTVAYPGGSPDIPDSRNRVDGYVRELRDKHGIKIVSTLEELADQCDAVLLESVDGRPHLQQFRAVAKGKPVFVDKPAAGSLADLLTIFRVADDTKTPVFTSSSLRFVNPVQAAARDDSLGEIIGCETLSPMSIQSSHPDLFWYGIHGVEPLFTILGPGCESVSRTDSPLSTVVVGKWKDGRLGSYRGNKKGHNYAFSLYGTKNVVQATGLPGKEGYDPAVQAICQFFKTGKPPVSREDMIEIYAFMEAADASKKEGGKPVKLADVIERAKKKSAQSDSIGGDKQ